MSGQLRCTTSCKLDTTSCATISSGEVHSLPELKSLFARFQPGLAVGGNGTKLAIAFASGTRFDFFAFDVHRLPKVAVRSTAVVGGDYRQDALAEFYSPKGPSTTAGRVVLAPLGAGEDYVAAVQRFGKNSATLLLRIHADGKIDVTGSYPGPPLFMAANKSRVLFGYSEGGSVLRLAVLGPDGKQVGSTSAPLTAASTIHDQLRASAAPDGDGWLVATGSAALSAPVEVLRIAADGKPAARERVGAGTGVVVARGNRDVVVFRGDDGLYIYERQAAGSIRLAHEPFLPLAATETGGPTPTLTLWMELGGRVVRLIRRDGQPANFLIEPVASVPHTRPVVGAVAGASIYVLFADEAMRVEPSIYVGSVGAPAGAP